jgi:putative Mg2+ transporter-C (MgtC) family protein
MLTISTQEAIIRLLAAFVISGLIGLEREYYRRPAGLRTNIMVGVGAALITIISVQAAYLFKEYAVDPTRIASQIVIGIGFLGAGIILQKGPSSVIGLTTAATLWVVAGLGIAIGFGLYIEAAVAAGLVFFTFFVLSKLVPVIRREKNEGREEE